MFQKDTDTIVTSDVGTNAKRKLEKYRLSFTIMVVVCLVLCEINQVHVDNVITGIGINLQEKK